jgi:hypothetical protein
MERVIPMGGGLFCWDFFSLENTSLFCFSQLLFALAIYPFSILASYLILKTFMA